MSDEQKDDRPWSEADERAWGAADFQPVPAGRRRALAEEAEKVQAQARRLVAEEGGPIVPGGQGSVGTRRQSLFPVLQPAAARQEEEAVPDGPTASTLPAPPLADWTQGASGTPNRSPLFLKLTAAVEKIVLDVRTDAGLLDDRLGAETARSVLDALAHVHGLAPPAVGSAPAVGSGAPAVGPGAYGAGSGAPAVPAAGAFDAIGGLESPEREVLIEAVATLSLRAPAFEPTLRVLAHRLDAQKGTAIYDQVRARRPDPVAELVELTREAIRVADSGDLTNNDMGEEFSLFIEKVRGLL